MIKFITVGIYFKAARKRVRNPQEKVWFAYSEQLFSIQSLSCIQLSQTILDQHYEGVTVYAGPSYRSSVFAAMIISFRCNPRILCVHHVTVTLPHSVRMAGW
jgi:hypothetical protein